MTTVAEGLNGDEPPQSRRGPMRPRRLVSVRANQSKRLSSHVFRAVDLAVLVLVTVALARHVSPLPVLASPVRQVAPLVVGSLMLGRALRAMRAYRFVRSESILEHLGLVASALAVGLVSFVVTALLTTSTLSLAQCWQWAVAAGGALAVLHVGWWLRVRGWRESGWLTPNLVIVGATEYAAHLIADAMQRRHVNVLGVFDDRLERAPSAIHGVQVLGDISALLAHRVMPYVDRIVVAVDPHATQRVRELAARLAVLPNEVTLFLSPDSASRSAALARLEDSPLAALDGGADLHRRALAKRLQDLLIGIPALIALSPLLALIAVLIKLDSRGPVFFRQRRHGFNNEQIVVWKFRSMRADAADARAERQVTADDDRVTRIGRFLRRSSLDELPQLLNVVRGEMSLVGPRPHAIGMKTGEIESDRLVAEYAHRHRIKPGMTGWAAINGSRGPLHAADDVQQRVALDIDYIARQSFRLDLRIMARTLPGLLGDRQVIR